MQDIFINSPVPVEFAVFRSYDITQIEVQKTIDRSRLGDRSSGSISHRICLSETRSYSQSVVTRVSSLEC
ncbi:MAG: hypothetical protein D6728_03070 [Cyanobacteria bacterium J055]|nr:MAG: hypothetical protein D6728_03070 [Cyanobacteria bacterium J055]